MHPIENIPSPNSFPASDARRSPRAEQLRCNMPACAGTTRMSLPPCCSAMIFSASFDRSGLTQKLVAHLAQNPVGNLPLHRNSLKQHPPPASLYVGASACQRGIANHASAPSSSGLRASFSWQFPTAPETASSKRRHLLRLDRAHPVGRRISAIPEATSSSLNLTSVIVVPGGSPPPPGPTPSSFTFNSDESRTACALCAVQLFNSTVPRDTLAAPPRRETT